MNLCPLPRATTTQSRHMAHFFAKTKQRFFGSEKTVDEKFEEQRGIFNEFKETTKQITKNMKRLECEIKNLVELQQSMATNAGEMYKDTHERRAELLREAGTSFTSAALACTDSLQFFITYLTGKMKQFDDFDKRIDARDSALLYADAKSESFHKLEEKKDAKSQEKLADARTKMEGARQEYETLNTNLLGELVKFSGDKTQGFDAQFDTFVRAQAKFASDSAVCLSLFLAQLQSSK